MNMPCDFARRIPQRNHAVSEEMRHANLLRGISLTNACRKGQTVERALFAEGIGAKEILFEVSHRIMERFAGIARAEAEFPCRFRTVQIPEVLSHFYGARLDRRSEIPLAEKRIDKLRAGDHYL